MNEKYLLTKSKFIEVESKINFAEIIGCELARIRKYQGMSGVVLANKIGISQQQISRYENGVNNLTINLLLRFLFFLDTTIFDFLNSISKIIKNEHPNYYQYYAMVLPLNENIQGVSNYDYCNLFENTKFG